MTEKKPRKIDDELLDEVGRHVTQRLHGMLSRIPDDDPSYYSPSTVAQFPEKKPAANCTFCGGAGQVEREIEDSMGTTLIITIDCFHDDH